MENEKYKKSRYTFECMDGENTVVYNAATDRMLVLIPQLYELYRKHENHLHDLKNVHKEFFNALAYSGIIVSEECNETEALVDFWDKQDNSPASFSITINPTLDCNLRCWYCYEKKNKGSRMSDAVLDSVKKLIAVKTGSNELRELSLSFFGGEPLMQFNDIIKPLILFADEQCGKRDIALKLAFTTNATLLTENAVKFLKPYNGKYPVFWQITLDGNREAHNRTKFETRQGDAFAASLNSTRMLASEGMGVQVRLNYTGTNLPTFVDLPAEFEGLDENCKKLLKFDFHRVWQDKSKIDKDKLDNVKEVFKKEGLNVMPSNELSPTRCYADKQNCVVVNYNGDIFKCTAREFAHELREGELLEDGTVKFNPLFERRMKIKFENPTCKECCIYPLCWGGCTQSKIEHDDLKGCCRGYSEKTKHELVEKRIKELLALNKQ